MQGQCPGESPKPEARVFWKLLPERVRREVVDHVGKGVAADGEHQEFIQTVTCLARAACTPETEPWIRKAAVALGLLPCVSTDYLSEAQKGQAIKYVKSSNGEMVHADA